MKKKTCYAVLCGQFISLLVTVCGVSSTGLQRLSVNVPTTQSALMYAALALWLVRVWRKAPAGTLWTGFRHRFKYYFPLALVDVEANFLVVSAFAYTNLSSVMLIDCFTVPCSMLLTWWFLGTGYTRWHVLGAAVCIMGIFLLALADWLGPHDPNAAGPPNPLLGDALCLGGAVLYAVSNVGQEACVKAYSRTEFMGWIGLYGSLIGGLQIFLVEYDRLRAIQWSWSVGGLLALFWLGQYLQYTVSPTLLLIAGAAMFNLSLLSSDVMSLVAGVLIFGNSLSPLYFVSAGVILLGLIIYNAAPDISREPGADHTGTSNGDTGHSSSADVGGRAVHDSPRSLSLASSASSAERDDTNNIHVTIESNDLDNDDDNDCQQPLLTTTN